MPIYIKDGTYRLAIKIWQKIDGVWEETPAWWIRHGGQYKQIHKTRNPFYFNVTLSSSVNYNLRDACIVAGWNQWDNVVATITIPVGVTIASTSSGSYAFSTGVTFPTDSSLHIILNGIITGRGGNGAGGNAYNKEGAPASAGGPGLFASIPCVLSGTGTLAAGGGGGGGGGGAWTNVMPYMGWSYAGGGGGGGGSGSGLGGLGSISVGQAPAYWPTLYDGGTGSAGTASAGGAGGGGGYAGGYFTDVYSHGGAGGAGGLGVTGASGGNAGWSSQYGGTTGPPTAGAPGGSAYAGTVNTDSFTGTIIGYRG